MLHVAAQCVQDCNTLLSPFLPHAANRVHAVLGGSGELMPMPRIEQVTELDPGDGAGLATYPVITGDYSATPRLASRVPSQVGTPVAKPTPVFTKLDPSVVEDGARAAALRPVVSRRHRDRSWPRPPEALPRPVVDNHTHLDHTLAATDGFGWRERSADGPGEAWLDREPTVADHLARAAAVGVTRMVQIGCDLPSIAWTDALLTDGPDALLGGLAIHPNEAVLHAGVREVAPDGLDPDPRAHHEVPLDDAIAEVARVAAANPRVRVIGETGLDFFRAGERGRVVQREAFRAHVALAKELGLVLQIHDRDAHDEVVEVLLADGAPERTVFHCFSGDGALAEVCAEHGWYLSFAGPVGYPASAGLRDALRVHAARPRAAGDRRPVPAAAPAPRPAQRALPDGAHRGAGRGRARLGPGGPVRPGDEVQRGAVRALVSGVPARSVGGLPGYRWADRAARDLRDYPRPCPIRYRAQDCAWQRARRLDRPHHATPRPNGPCPCDETACDRRGA